MRTLPLLALLPLASLFASLFATGFTTQVTGKPNPDFDFWIGEWSVQNRDLQADGSWKDSDVTRARITPLLAGHALLEEWSGPFGQSYMNGFSLRAWNPEAEHWTIVLFWTTDGNASFGRMNGNFRHGRGEFLAGSGPQRTRYTFSDALPQTVRWDSARSQDAGLTWKTDWIMEFSRTEEAEAMSADRLFSTPWKEGKVSPHEEARELDWLVGSWRGEIAQGAGKGSEARLRCALLNQDCLLVDLLETRASEEDPWEGRLFVRGYVAAAKKWQAIGLTEEDTVIRNFEGQFEKGEVRFVEQTSGRSGSSEVMERDGKRKLAIRSRNRKGKAVRFELSRAKD